MEYIGTKIEGKEYQERKTSYGLIFNENGEIAVAYIEKYNMYNLIGGKIEEQENSKEALIRETQEEIGYSIKDIEYIDNLGCYYYFDIMNKYELSIMDFYKAKIDKKVCKPIEDDHQLIWVKPEEIADKMYFEYHRYFLRNYIENNKLEKIKMQEVFRFGRCLFAKPDINYVNEMVEMMNNEKISSMLFNEKRIITRDMELEWIENHQDDNTFSVFDVNTLEYIGNCGYNEIEDGRGEIGIVIREKMQGKHYAKEIIKGLIDYGFNVLGLDEIYAIIFSDNTRSLNCVIQLSFQEYKREKNVIERNGNTVDDIYLNLKRNI